MFDVNDPNAYAQNQGNITPTLPGGQANPAQFQMPFNANPLVGMLAPLIALAAQRQAQQQQVQPTSSLPASTVAQATGKSLKAPQQQQQAPTSKLSVGNISQALKPTPTQNTGGMISHVVKPGDTLWSIAHQYTGNGNNWTKLQGFHQDPRTLQAGTVIHIPQNLAQGQNIGKAPSNVYAGGGNIG